MLEKNYRKICSLKEIVSRPIDGVFQEVPKDFSMKTLVEETLTTAGFAEKRARTMAIEDFLALMLAFNRANIHFA